jgi:hypothetical protein
MTASTHAIESVIWTYLDGLHEADRGKLDKAFHEACHFYSVVDEKLVDVPRDAVVAAITGRPSAKSQGLARHDWIVTIDRSGPDTAFAKVQCAIPPRFFTDYLSLARLQGTWRIVSKTYHTEVR